MKKTKSVSISDFPQQDENPFVTNIVVPTRTKNTTIATKNGSAVIDLKTGEVDDSTLFFAQQKVLDKEPFIKLFQSQLKILFGLSNTGIRMFAYFAERLRFEDFVLINWDEAKKYTKLKTDGSVQRGLANLLDAGIIARSKYNSMYFINPTIFFKGDRIVLVTEYRRKRPGNKYDSNQGLIFDTNTETRTKEFEKELTDENPTPNPS